jgi:methyl coenzyme M reductase alpha subunit
MPFGDMQHNFLKAMSDKFAERPKSTVTDFYVHDGIAQKGGKRKREFICLILL